MKTIIHYTLHDVAPYIHWGYFFHAWGLPFARESMTADERQQADKLHDEALETLHEMDGSIQAHALVGLYAAGSQGNDIVLWDDGGTQHTLPMLRQQHGETCLCLSDYVRPISGCQTDMIGLFVTSVDEAMEQAAPDDPYRHLLCQTLADRLAEATSEKAHETVRRELWGYAADEQLGVAEMLAEKYQGRRPAVGYPSLPDQSINFLLDEILDFNQIGVRLTESGAMAPHASTSGLMLSHPAMRHFAVGRIGQDQLADYARRRGFTIEKMKRFLATNL